MNSRNLQEILTNTKNCWLRATSPCVRQSKPHTSDILKVLHLLCQYFYFNVMLKGSLESLIQFYKFIQIHIFIVYITNKCNNLGHTIKAAFKEKMKHKNNINDSKVYFFYSFLTKLQVTRSTLTKLNTHRFKSDVSR